MSIVPASLKDHLRNVADGLLAALGEISPKPQIARAPDGGPILLVRSGYDVKVLPTPTAYRRTHQIEDIASLSEWLKRHGKPEIVEVFVGDQQAIAALQPANVDGDVVVMPLANHPRWERWRAVLDQPISQKQLWKLLVSAAEDFPAIPIEGSAKGATTNEGERLSFEIMKLSAVKTSECAVEMDERGTVTYASACEKTSVSGKIPPRFKLRVPMLIGVSGPDGSETAYEVEIHVGVEAKEKGPPWFVLSCPGLQVLRRTARLDAAACLQRGLPDFLVGVGEFKTSTRPVRDWVV